MGRQERETFTAMQQWHRRVSHVNVPEHPHSGPPQHMEKARVMRAGPGWWSPVAWAQQLQRGVARTTGDPHSGFQLQAYNTQLSPCLV